MENIPVSWALVTFIGTVIVGAVGITGGVLYSVFRWVYVETNDLRAHITANRIEVAQSYVTKSALIHLEERMEKQNTRIEEALNRLADRFDAAMRRFTPPHEKG